MQKYHTSSVKYCLEHTKFPDDFLKIKSMLTGKWIIWSDLNHFWVKKIIWKTTVFKVSTNQALQKPSTWRKSSKFKSESFYMVAARTEWAPPSEGVMARSPSIFTSIFTCGTCGLKSMRKNSKPWLIRNDEVICRECSKQ